MRFDVLEHGTRFGAADDFSVNNHVRLLGLHMIKNEPRMGDQQAAAAFAAGGGFLHEFSDQLADFCGQCVVNATFRLVEQAQVGLLQKQPLPIRKL